jgi:hypothetical protein
MMLLFVQDARQEVLASVKLVAIEYLRGSIQSSHAHGPASGEGEMGDRLADLIVSM